MSKHDKRGRKPKQELKSKASPQSEPKTEERVSDNPFDFGGMPERDLKKNLGCG